MSLYGWMARLPIPVKTELPVVRVSVWHKAQPIRPKSRWPFWADGDCATGVGGAERRMKAANIAVSEAPVAALFPARLVESSGLGLYWQPAAVARSLGNTSFETPCSTLYASPAKMSSDLFCAFQPKRVIDPSFPVRFSLP